MEWKQFWIAFSVIFLAELGDKTQLAVITMSAASRQALSIFFGGALALVLLTGAGVVAGYAVTKYLPENVLSKVAALLFIFIGVWTWIKS